MKKTANGVIRQRKEKLSVRRLLLYNAIAFLVFLAVLLLVLWQLGLLKSIVTFFF